MQIFLLKTNKQNKKTFKKKVERCFDPASPLLGIYLKNLKIFICKVFTAAPFSIAKTWK